MDGDAFFVGVEVAKNPRLRGLPVVTGEERGIVSALSYEAKALGIHRGMPIFRVKKEFPSVRILPGDYAAYERYSGMMFEIVKRYADDVEEYSIDECFADLTGLEPPLKMSYREIALRIKREIEDELHLSVSIGLAPTKVLAKVASKWVKPNGFTVITMETLDEYLRGTPVEKLWGIGGQTATKLWRLGVRTAADFVSRDIAWVRHHFALPQEAIWQELRGVYLMHIDPTPKTVYSSIQKTRTFHPATVDPVFLRSQLSKHIEDACSKARHFSLAPRKLSIFLKTRDFEYHTRSITLHSSTHAPEVLMTYAENMLQDMLATMPEESRGRPTLYRTAGVTLHDLIPDTIVQGDLFTYGPTRAKKFETIHRQIDSLEDKFGRRVVYLASTHDAVIRSRKEKGTDAEDLDRDLLFL